MRNVMVSARRSFGVSAAVALALLLTAPRGLAAKPQARIETVFDTNKLAQIDQTIATAIAEQRLPGAVLWLERDGVAYHRAYGQRALRPEAEAMTEDTIFDLASLTKVIATAPSIMLLVERGQVRLDARVQEYLPEFRRDGKDAITIRQLLTHTSGLRSGLGRKVEGPASALSYACQEKITSAPGTAFLYSDINFILLGEVVQRVARSPLATFAAVNFFAPLKMRETDFQPWGRKVRRIAPTVGAPRGTVHDPTARGMGGVAGHAGLFSTAADLARFARMVLNGGELEGRRVLQADTIRLMTSVQTPETLLPRRGLGWDIDTSYSRRGAVFPLGSFGHTGFTGTSLWIDPFSRTFLIFLSNRVHPDGHGDVRTLQTTLGTLAAQAVLGFDFTNVAGALPARTNVGQGPAIVSTGVTPADPKRVLNGIDVLKKQGFAAVKNLRLGLITNHTGQDREGNSTIDLLRSAPGVTLQVLFSPEHGIRGQLDEKVDDSVDARTGLPVYSLYGQRRSPSPEQLAGLDALVFDIQDIGCRFYTYISTMGLCLEAAAKAGLRFIVLDRVNPINGLCVEGGVYQGDPLFTAHHALPLRHAMTVGELARLFNQERDLKAKLSVIPLQGWARAMWFEETGLPWVNPSPNMRNMRAAVLYPGVGLVEFAISVGRGTDTPFELVGAPYIDGEKLAAAMNAAGLPGLAFEPVRFTPKASIFKNQECGGVSIQLTNREPCVSVDLGLALALAIQKHHPDDFDLEKVNVLLQDLVALDAIRAGRTVAEIKQEWARDLERFRQRREKHLLY
jgi:uncharacterized protein YbbC (DUF1343 family)/CubicO group peptidase (beta-lactamase class C family)